MLRLTRRPHPLLAFLASGARAASMAAPFFTTEGRLMRGAGADLTKQFVPVHKGMSLIQPAAGGGLEAALVSEAAARPYVDGATETLIGTAEEGALGRRAAGGAFWLLDVSHLPEPPAPAALGLDGATWQPLRDRAGWSARESQHRVALCVCSDDDRIFCRCRRCEGRGVNDGTRARAARWESA